MSFSLLIVKSSNPTLFSLSPPLHSTQLHSLRESVLLMVKIKRADLRRKAREEGEKEAKESGSSDTNATKSVPSTVVASSKKRAATPVKHSKSSSSSKKME